MLNGLFFEILERETVIGLSFPCYAANCRVKFAVFYQYARTPPGPAGGHVRMHLHGRL